MKGRIVYNSRNKTNKGSEKLLNTVERKKVKIAIKLNLGLQRNRIGKSQLSIIVISKIMINCVLRSEDVSSLLVKKIVISLPDT